MDIKQEDFAQAANNWDLDTLYTDLASAKGKHLTPVEKLHLRGLLCGHSPAEIAEKLGKSVKGVESEMSIKLYVYIKNLVGKTNEKVDNWRNVIEWLDDAGYKMKMIPPPQYDINDGLPNDTWCKIGSISIEKDKIMIIGFCVHDTKDDAYTDRSLENLSDGLNHRHLTIDKSFGMSS